MSCGLPVPGPTEDFTVKQRLPEPPFQLLTVEPLVIGARRAEILALVRSLELHEV